VEHLEPTDSLLGRARAEQQPPGPQLSIRIHHLRKPGGHVPKEHTRRVLNTTMRRPMRFATFSIAAIFGMMMPTLKGQLFLFSGAPDGYALDLVAIGDSGVKGTTEILPPAHRWPAGGSLFPTTHTRPSPLLSRKVLAY
jgi:hypothetical protein